MPCTAKKMSRLFTLTEATRLIPLDRKALKKWIKKGMIDTKTLGDEVLIPEREIEKAKKILRMGLSERMKRRAEEQNISHLLKLCANEEFSEIAAELGLHTPPQNVRECYSTVRRVLAQSEEEKNI